MNALLTALAGLVSDWGWLMIVAIFFGGGDVMARIFSGRRANTRLRIQRDAARENAAFLERQLDKALNGKPITSSDARTLDVLGQVQASDNAYPQLPGPVRERLDMILDDHWKNEKKPKKAGKNG